MLNCKINQGSTEKSQLIGQFKMQIVRYMPVRQVLLAPAFLPSCLDALQKLKFFSLSITSIFGPMHKVVNVGKKK
jgi:hypothetical protein